jgi:homoserine O-acetyltransferase/O-succinyltransferase
MITSPPEPMTPHGDTVHIADNAAPLKTRPRALPFWRGGSLDVEIAYETWGTLDARKSNVVFILPGLSPDAHATSSTRDPSPGWWEDMVGPQKNICTDKHFVICINHLGSCFGSTGPASKNHAGEVLGMSFPKLSIEDLALAATYVLDELKIESAHTLIGPSMGGLVALAFMLRYPNRFERGLIISSAARAEAHSIAIHSLQREAICNDPKWMNGQYAEHAPPLSGMRLARKIGMSSYRSSIEWEERFGNRRANETTDHPFAFEFTVESYLRAVAKRFADNFDANAYLYLSRAMDWFDVGYHGASATDALRRLSGKSVGVISVTTDQLFPPRQQELLANALTAAGVETTYTVVSSLKGHDAFLVDIKRMGPVINHFINGE